MSFVHAAAACAQIRPTGSFCCALHASLACLRVCVCGRRLPFEHGGHMLQTLQLADEGGGSLQSSRSTLLPGDDMGSTGTISAQSSGLSLGLGQGQEPLSGTARMPYASYQGADDGHRDAWSEAAARRKLFAQLAEAAIHHWC